MPPAARLQRLEGHLEGELWAARWEVAIPAVVLGSVLGGFATLVEASSITVLSCISATDSAAFNLRNTS